MSEETTEQPNDNKRIGIIMPALAYRFKMSIPLEPDLTEFVMSTDLNLVSKTFKVVFRDDILGKVKDSIDHLSKVSKFDTELSVFSKIDQIENQHNMRLCSLLSHSLKYDYANEKIATHEIVIKYEYFDRKSLL